MCRYKPQTMRLDGALQSNVPKRQPGPEVSKLEQWKGTLGVCNLRDTRPLTLYPGLGISSLRLNA
jgi:hypothetical protein